MVWRCGVRPDARLMNFLRGNWAMGEPTIHEVSKELATLRDQMNTHQAKYEGALDRFRADMGSFRADMSKNDTAFERLRTDMAKRDADAAHREINHIRWMIGMWTAGVLVTIAALGIFIRLAI